MSSKLLNQSTDWLKPYPSEAILRMRNSGLCILLLLSLTALLPIPAPWTSILVIFSQNTKVSTWWWSLCAIESTVLGILALTVSQALFAIKYPRAPTPPPSTPSKKTIRTPVSTKRFKTFSPLTSPQQQKTFSSSYATSPISTPSRVLNYSTSPFNTSLGSTSSLPPSPSPILSAYRGKHPTAAGQSFDGALLNRLVQTVGEDDD